MSLDWPSFEALPGDPRINFENLCRGIIQRHWASCGQFNALKNQPGVEFHLKLNQNCEGLGDASRWYGWQCKKFDLTKDGSLTAASRRTIKDSLDKTVEHLPGLTDWILWTHFTLSKPDQEWFQGLASQYPYVLHLWTDKEMDNYLVGPAMMLRSTYFTELVVTPEDLKSKHNEALDPIKDRWLNPVHQETNVERVIWRMLGEPNYWKDMIDIGERLSEAADQIEAWNYEDSTLKSIQKVFIDACNEFSNMLIQFHEILSNGDIDIIRQWLSNRNLLISSEIKSFPRLLHKQNVPIALEATNTLDDMCKAQNLFDEVERYLGVGIVAILADAGGGKTHMAAEVTSAQENRPAGVFLHGRNFRRGQNHNDLARQFIVNGTPLDSMEKLLACLDAAAKRACCILPLVIDGLNEAENPKEWKDVLSSIRVLIKDYPNVLVICTLRTGEYRRNSWQGSETETRESFAVQSLPEGIWIEECEGFGEDLHDAINKYFDYYKIHCEAGIEIPSGFLNHPLNLRIFCDITNSERKKLVEINYFPASLVHLFEKYIENACNRIAAMKNLPYSSQELKSAIYQLGISLWDSKEREISDQIYRDLIGDKGRNWNESIVNLFAQEGVVFRNPGKEPGTYVITPIYDALGGYIIADTLLKKHAQDRDFEWLSSSSVASAFSGNQSHALSQDIFKSLVGLVPSQMYGKQLWRHAPEQYKQKALLYAADLNPEHIDEDTVKALAKLISEKSAQVRKIFSRIWLTKGALKHPLNANFLNDVLMNMSVTERDLSWTEWLRSEKDIGKDRIAPELANLEDKWRNNLAKRTEVDRLRARAVKWLLTSTSHRLRNAATRALYWFGRGDPEFLFDETIKSFEVNDPYIPERMLAASYGVAMSLSVQPSNGLTFANSTLSRFAGQIFETMFKENAQYYTTHQFIRDFSSKIIELTQYHNSHFFSGEDAIMTKPPYKVEKSKKWGEKYIDSNDSLMNYSERIFRKFMGKRFFSKLETLVPQEWKDKAINERIKRRRQSPFFMDFENYTIGGLVPDRGNYDYDHKEYQKIRAQLQWRVEELGWSYEKFEAAENAIQSWQNYEQRSNEKFKTDRYGKKYSWIAYYEMYGLLKDRGILDDYDWWRSAEQNIDPSFPFPLPSQKIIEESFLGHAETNTLNWIKNDNAPNIGPYLKLQEIDAQEGPWIALDGYLNQEDKDLKRKTFLFVRSFLVPKNDKNEIIAFLNKQNLGGRWLPEKLDFSQIFFAEIPWSSSFLDNDFRDLSFVVNEKITTRQRPKVNIMTTNKGVSIAVYDQMEEYQEIQKEYKTFKVIMPICDLKQDVVDTEVGGTQTLTKKISTKMELVGQPQSFSLYTKCGKKATHYVSYKGKEYNDRQSMYYLKEDLLIKFMEENELSLIWAIWGERSHSFSRLERPNDSLPEPRYKVFNFIKEYNPQND